MGSLDAVVSFHMLAMLFQKPICCWMRKCEKLHLSWRPENVAREQRSLSRTFSIEKLKESDVPTIDSSQIQGEMHNIQGKIH